jgi:hypothetical protein
VLGVGYRETRADGQGGELVHCVAAGSPVCKFLVVKALGHIGAPFTCLRIDLDTIDTHCATKAPADLECRLNDGIPPEARWDRIEMRDFTGRAAADHSVPPRLSTSSIVPILSKQTLNGCIEHGTIARDPEL